VLLYHVAENWGWRIAFLIGPVLALVIIFVRRNLPESPRWLVMHGREREAEDQMANIERWSGERDQLEALDETKAIEVKPAPPFNPLNLLVLLFRRYPSRSTLGASLMITQSFLYNAIFFTYTLVLTKVYGVNPKSAPWYLIAFAAGNLIGPLTIGRLFDTWGRKTMIAGTYILSGVLLAISAEMFREGHLNATTQTIWWAVIFFFASSGASAAYLTVSEIFPLELRGQAISYFFAIGQVAGAIAPTVFGALVGEGTSRGPLTIGYYFGAGIMILGGLIAWFFGVNAEGQSPEDVADPLSKAPVEHAS